MKTETTTLDLRHVKPRLKVGTIVMPLSEHTYVGRMDCGLEIASPARVALAAMSGTQSCLELSVSLGIPFAQIEALVMELDQAALIDTEAAKIAVHTRFHSPNIHRASHELDDSNDGAFQQMQSKLSPELSFTTWLANVRDGGISLISERRNCEINIFGDSRIASLLYGILLGSGVSRTVLHAPATHKTISEEDLCAGFLHSGDIGLSFNARTQELARELSLFPMSQSGQNNDPITRKFAVSIGNVPADRLQSWMSEGVPHLIIDNPDGASITVGPMVIPGQTPCARCITMVKEGQNEAWRDIAWQKLISPPAQTPVAVAHYVAGLAALEILRFLDEGASELLGSCSRINYHRPGGSELRLFTRHPACGCNWQII